MVKLRMRRTGCKNHAAYRIVAADERSPRDGKFLEILGWYDTALKENNFKLDLERPPCQEPGPEAAPRGQGQGPRQKGRGAGRLIGKKVSNGYQDSG